MVPQVTCRSIKVVVLNSETADLSRARRLILKNSLSLPLNGGAAADPHFLYHAVTRCPTDPEITRYFDPSYGVAYSVAGLEAKTTEVAWGAPSLLRKLLFRLETLPPEGERVHSAYVCPHPP